MTEYCTFCGERINDYEPRVRITFLGFDKDGRVKPIEMVMCIKCLVRRAM